MFQKQCILEPKGVTHETNTPKSNKVMAVWSVSGCMHLAPTGRAEP